MAIGAERRVVRKRGFCAHDTVHVIDGDLRRLAGQNARCRAVLGRLARRFLTRSGHHDLGFARVGDYARERLGLSARELQSLAAVAAGMDRLPETRAAFEAGELSWSQVRLLVNVATRDEEADWLAIARGRTVRALAAVIRARGRPASEDETDDVEPAARFRVGCPRRVLRLWGAVVELARRVAGSDLTHGQAAEAIAAEGLAARRAPDGAWRPGPAPATPPADADETRAAFAGLDWTPVTDAIPDDVAELAHDVATLDAAALDDRMRRVLRALHRIDWQTGRLLRVVLDRRLYRLVGFSSGARYVTERLAISARKARMLVALDRKTGRAPALGDAYRDGKLSALQALTILPVVCEPTADAWVARAQAVTLRRLGDEVEWALGVGDRGTPTAPPPARVSLAIAERQTCARVAGEPDDADLVFTAPVSVVALFRAAILAFGPRADGLERLLLHVKAEWEAQPPHRDPIFARDGWRCAVPVCTARRDLHDHHLVFRSRGGADGRENRVTVCAWHHLRGIHAGRVRAWGEAPDGITWEIGVRPGRRPLLRLDAYGWRSGVRSG